MGEVFGFEPYGEAWGHCVFAVPGLPDTKKIQSQYDPILYRALLLGHVERHWAFEELTSQIFPLSSHVHLNHN